MGDATYDVFDEAAAVTVPTTEYTKAATAGTTLSHDGVHAAVYDIASGGIDPVGIVDDIPDGSVTGSHTCHFSWRVFPCFLHGLHLFL